MKRTRSTRRLARWLVSAPLFLAACGDGIGANDESNAAGSGAPNGATSGAGGSDSGTSGVGGMDGVGAGGTASSGAGGAPSGVTIHATADMEDGTLGDLVAAGNKSNLGSNYIHVVDDPTGLLSGKVAQIHYQRLDTSSSKDRNNSFDWLPPASEAIGLGETIYVRGTFVMPLPAAGLEATQRKLFYWQTQNNATSHFVIKYEDDRIVASLYNATTGHRLFKAMVGQAIFASPHTLEALVAVNSATDAADGVLQVWLDGVELFGASDVLFQDTPGDWVRFKVGQQVNVSDASETFDEYRYWDDVVIASGRVP